ncbi:hypothetical protein Tco_0800130 [Tanacetum coccineum]|uniref:Uncharacterized protein n=1 Tax=Tanacetum coccineum TaxID=301880 RepID=A0ABQ4ZW94_9ASTR
MKKPNSESFSLDKGQFCNTNVIRLRDDLDRVQTLLDQDPFNINIREQEALTVADFNQAVIMEEHFLRQKAKVSVLKRRVFDSAYYHKNDKTIKNVFLGQSDQPYRFKDTDYDIYFEVCIENRVFPDKATLILHTLLYACMENHTHALKEGYDSQSSVTNGDSTRANRRWLGRGFCLPTDDRWLAIFPNDRIASYGGWSDALLRRFTVSQVGWNPFVLETIRLMLSQKLKPQDRLAGGIASSSLGTACSLFKAGLDNVPNDVYAIIIHVGTGAKRKSTKIVIAKLVLAAAAYYLWQERNKSYLHGYGVWQKVDTPYWEL